MKKILSLVLCIVLSLAAVTLYGCKKKPNEYTKDGRMILKIRNLYFNEWTGGDAYTSYIEDKFGVAIEPSSYSWADWDNQVYGPANSNNLSDVFHFSLDSYNFANSYEFWARGGSTKALPDDLSAWPHIADMLGKVSNLNELKINGKLYCIPLIKNIKDADDDYSPFTYVYRRDWAKELGVYQEDDVYTWNQFQNLLSAFYRAKSEGGSVAALADVEWGFPSIINFYKTAPHCFAMEGGSAVCNFVTPQFKQGLELAKNWASGGTNIYGFDQYAANDGDVAKQFYAGRVGVFYENLSLANYTTLRKKVGERKEIDTKEKLDDATAIMKVSGPDGKYALEGGENWFSATFFSADISDEKLNKILDIIDWLLGEEGTMMAAYGIKDYDYTVSNGGEVTLLEAGWERDINGKYIEKLNGAKYLRYMATLGYDMNDYDPLVDKEALSILTEWKEFINRENAQGNLRILTEDPSVKWLSTTNKSQYAGGLLENGNASVQKYVYGKITLGEYENSFTTQRWGQILGEINSAIGK
ncbi:MAG: hypothetical protein J6Z34_03445 [Clostridia bacterium]|nr:hypothetical protein [Clostridia bacterium]